MLNNDYKEMLQSLSAQGVKYLVVGAYAMSAYGYVRATADIDIWVMASGENSAKVYKALAEFGVPLSGITAGTFAEKNIVFQIGVNPRRIDILTELTGLDFEESYSRLKEVDIDGLIIPFISKQDLIRNKEATGRAKDILDARELRASDKPAE